jgi:triacylglycerol lipase
MAYGANKMGGKATLDGIRALQNASELQVTNRKIGLEGYPVAGWRRRGQRRWAGPTLRNSTLSGQPPRSMNLVKMSEALGANPHPAFGLAMAAALGLAREYPDRVNVTANSTTTVPVAPDDRQRPHQRAHVLGSRSQRR